MSIMSNILSVDKFYSKSSQKDLRKMKHLAEIEAIESGKMYKQQVNIYVDINQIYLHLYFVL